MPAHQLKLANNHLVSTITTALQRGGVLELFIMMKEDPSYETRVANEISKTEFSRTQDILEYSTGNLSLADPVLNSNHTP